MLVHAVGLKTHIWNNNFRSILLLLFYPLVMAAAIWGIVTLCIAFSGHTGGGGGGVQAREHLAAGALAANAVLLEYWPMIVMVVMLWFMVCWFTHTKMIRALSNSHPVTRQEEPELYNLVENLCISRGMKTPRLEIIETPQRNAFASGIDENSYAITVTRGLMQALEKDELEAVIGHELTHIINRDVRLLIVSIIFTGMFGFIAQLFWRTAFRATSGRGRKDGRVMLLLLAVGIILWAGYLATAFTRFALSRRREFMADAGAVELTRNPDAMMRALARIAGADRIPGAAEDVALMCIENSHKFMGLFATHPPIARRIAVLSEMTGVPAPEAGAAEAAHKNRPWG